MTTCSRNVFNFTRKADRESRPKRTIEIPGRITECSLEAESQMQPSFLIRQADPRDHRQIIRLARELDSINLPTESAELANALDRSSKSFAGRLRRREDTVYIFCAEELQSHRIAAVSMIIGKHGTPDSPHYYFEMNTDERYSQSLHRMFRHPYLRLRYSMDGPSELGGLIVDPAMRGHPEHIGTQISWVRFLYIARHRARFEHKLIAEMLAPSTPNHGNLFWDYYGGLVTGLSYQEADRLSTHDKEFIRTLFPDSPLYTFLMPPEVVQSIGQVADSSRGAVKLLEKAGMKFLEHIDPFDAGPYYGASTEDLVPIRECQTFKATAGESDAEESSPYLIGVAGPKGFRAVQAKAIVEKSRIVLTRDTLDRLAVREGAMLDTLPLP
jgi:arginine N-succinyltransferase